VTPLPGRPPDWRTRALQAVRQAERIRWPHIEVRDVVVVLLLGATLLFVAHYVNSTQAAQRRQGAAVERKLCSTLGGLAHLQPPPGNPSTNPSRAYLQGLHSKFIDLGRDLGCGPVS
jgi:hypothetical protein